MQTKASLLAVAALSFASTAPANVQFTTAAQAVLESSGQVVLAVRRAAPLTGAASVDWATAAGTASAGADFTGATGTVSWAAGEGGEKLVTIQLPDDAAIEPIESFTVALANATGTTLGTRASSTVRLRDDDTEYNFEKAFQRISENALVVQVGVTRKGHPAGAGAVNYAAVGGLARTPGDYEALGGQLTWGADEIGTKYFNVVLRNDTVTERNETLLLGIDAPVAGTVGPLALSKLVIENDDCPLPAGTSVVHSWDGTVQAAAAQGGTVAGEPHHEAFALPVGCAIASMTVRIQWDLAAEDLDLYVTQPDGSVVSDASFQTHGEAIAQVTLTRPKIGAYDFESVGYISANTSFHGTAVVVVAESFGALQQPGLPVGRGRGIDDAVVIAVVDTGFNPYHFDFLSKYMPQHLNTDLRDDLPLDQDPATWLPGHPGAAAFASYQALNLTLTPDDPNKSTDALHTQDQAEWNKIRYSPGTDNAQVNMVWIPGTKVIGHVAFSPGLVGDPWTSLLLGPLEGPVDTWQAASHGVGTTSVSTGNLYGGCPSCLLVFVDGTSEQASQWVAKQDWIDLQSNSWGAATVYRERSYAGSDTELQRTTVERGQSIFFSAGNGQENAFVVPNTTLFSSQEGPDWIITVGAIEPSDGSSYTGHGKPADIAGIGGGYPSAYGSGDTTTNNGGFSGTSNATPQLAGMFGEALYRLRRMLPGPSRMQDGGVIASGTATCGARNPACALADGNLTVHELREAFFRAAQYTPAGASAGGVVPLVESENQAELEYISEGHGSYWGRVHGFGQYEDEIRRIANHVRGVAFTPLDPQQRDFFIADSLCRQAAWGPWSFGESQAGPAPAASNEWPIRSFYTEDCPTVVPPIIEAEKEYWGIDD